MKKYILLLAAQALLISANAQKIDKALIYGRWTAHSFSGAGYDINTDSLKQLQTAKINVAVAKAPSHLLSKEDSLSIVKSTQALGKKVDDSYLEFKKDGKYTSLTLFAEGDGEVKPKAGTFKWIGDNKITITNPEGSEVFTVKMLTATKLTIIGNEGKEEEKYQVQFKKK